MRKQTQHAISTTKQELNQTSTDHEQEPSDNPVDVLFQFRQRTSRSYLLTAIVILGAIWILLKWYEPKDL